MLGEHSGLSFMLKAQNWRFHSITIRFRTTYSYIHRVFLLSSYFDFFFFLSFLLFLWVGLDGHRNILGIWDDFFGFVSRSLFGDGSD